MRDRINYFKRIFRVYFSKQPSYLSFWHETPAVSEGIAPNEFGPYYMTFADKANYDGPQDADGVILFDYFFDIGRQYNPLAVAQYGLGHFNKYLKLKSDPSTALRASEHFRIAKIQAEWLVKNLEPNDFGVPVWKHKFRWHYKHYLPAGWFSGHSQGTGISLLGRLYQETNDSRYLEAAKQAFIALKTPISHGGVQMNIGNDTWLEEYLVEPPTHILNGFLWGLWGVWDYYLLVNDPEAKKLWDDCVKTLDQNLHKFDFGFWSKYDLSEQFLPMIASPFYHKLHIVQLRVMHILTKGEIFNRYAQKFEWYQKNWLARNLALALKAIFKIFYF